MFGKLLSTFFICSFIIIVVILSPSLYAVEEYKPQINPAEFTTEITNKYFTLPVGKKMIYEAETEEGLEKIEIVIESETKIIAGIRTLIYRDKVWLNGELVEDTKDYLAQDKEGNVWYFGEDVNNYENGKLIDHKGSFIAGENGAKPGIWIKGSHKVGDSYRQEYYKGVAEDMRDVIALNQTIKTKLATYTDCIKLYDWTPLDPESKEYKYYCPAVGAVVLTEHIMKGKRSELTSVTLSLRAENIEEELDDDENWPIAIGFGIGGLLAGFSIGQYKSIKKILNKKK